ncbi:MAG TPA: arylamine N-acetyltransferase [Candidatus Baltobacteraceae bacterium]|nr:arylamine N-acetyltransferase [Candidatus Baltobacteraceae bacterium]
MTKLHRYLRRVGYGGPLSPTRQTLHNLHRAHLFAIPFENIDVQMGIRPSFDLDVVFDKIVERGRGGWCYEMNGIFAWALRELGFSVDLVGAAVGREKFGSASLMNHLALIVHLDLPYLADVGFGNGMLLPAPLREGTFSDGRFEFRLKREGDWWRFYNHRHNGSTYDFTERPYEYADFESKGRLLASTAESPFVRNLVVGKLTEDGMTFLANAAFLRFTGNEIAEETAPNGVELQRILRKYFDLDVDPIDGLWNRVASQQRDATKRKLRGF